MFKSRCVDNTPDIDTIDAEISILKSKIDDADKEVIENAEIDYDELTVILDEEISSLRHFIEFETKKQNNLSEEIDRISKNMKKEENLISSIEEYMKKMQFPFGLSDNLDDTMELFFKLEVMHRQISRFIKKISRDYITFDEHDVNGPSNIRTDVESPFNVPEKNLLYILKMLLHEISDKKEEAPVQIQIDDTMDDRAIEFLLSTNIIEKCTNDPSYVKLSDFIII